MNIAENAGQFIILKSPYEYKYAEYSMEYFR